ncbi:MAG: hypothetical protein QOH90_1029, partial [Actinomycetota bacterium]|nr:hypothetical protein [Actinomycetota bacterium]
AHEQTGDATKNASGRSHQAPGQVKKDSGVAGPSFGNHGHSKGRSSSHGWVTLFKHSLAKHGNGHAYGHYR